MTIRTVSVCIATSIAALYLPPSADAQSLGTFRWQLQPYCNVVALAVTQNGGVYELEGTDDQCGAGGAPASAIGTAFPNADGSIALGLNIVAAPSGAPVHVMARINLGTLGGTWQDSAAGSGSFVFTPGAGAGGSPRPPPANLIAPGAVGSTQVDASQVQLRVNGSCSSSTFMQSVAQSGSAICGAEVGDVSEVTAGPGLIGGGSSGSVTLSLPLTETSAFSFSNGNGFAATGAFGNGAIPWTGPGTRAMWYPGKAAFRAGRVGSQWDAANIGDNSVAFGLSTTASGPSSVALGQNTTASGAYGVALGDQTTASGQGALSAGELTLASGVNSVALGFSTIASGAGSVALGSSTRAAGLTSVALGRNAIAASHGSFVFADRSSNNSFTSELPNEFGVRAAGGVYLYTSSNLGTGCWLPAGSGVWSCASDRNSKEHFDPVDGEMVLTKLRAMPIERWSYRSEPGVAHVGPVAQDFHAAFGLGVDDKTVGHLDLSGIALRAIQALEARTRDLAEENAALRKRLEQLEKP